MTATYSNWRKSSRSGSQANCVEVGSTPNTVGVRDTKDRTSGTVELTTRAWTAFITNVKQGRVDPGS